MIITADYSNIELRILAEITGDEAFREAFLKGKDLHRETAARIFGCRTEDVTPQMRGIGKGLNFGVVYGIGARRFAAISGQSEEAARRMLERYFAAHPKLDGWMKQTVREVLDTKQVRSLSGRIIRWEFDSADREQAAAAQRFFWNAPAQATSSDILKRALVLLGEALPQWNSYVVNCIHDEILVEAPAEVAREVASIISEKMKEAAQKSLPHVPVEVKPVIAEAWQKN